jgi:hypothetical protein
MNLTPPETDPESAGPSEVANYPAASQRSPSPSRHGAAVASEVRAVPEASAVAREGADRGDVCRGRGDASRARVRDAVRRDDHVRRFPCRVLTSFLQ